MPSVRPRRSVLYMPASNARALDKARSLPVDSIIFDLEDAVAPSAKDEARHQAVQALSQGGYGAREMIVRANDLSTPWGYADLAAIAHSAAHGLALPKVESADMVQKADAILNDCGASDALGLWCMVETPQGVLNVAEIAKASPRIIGLIMGTSDLGKDLRCAQTPDRLPLLTSLSLCLLAARAHGLVALDGVHLDLNDEDGFVLACQQGRDLGFDGKTLIHPKTAETANRIFGPSDAELAWSRRVIAAHAHAVANGQGVVVVDNRLVENLHIAQAQRILAMAKAIAILTDSGQSAP